MLMSLMLALVLNSSALEAASNLQRLEPVPATQVVAAGDLATVTVMYDSEDQTVTGVGMRVHYDSLRITLESVSALYSNMSVGAGESEENSYWDSDGDPNTDRVFAAAWADLTGGWPGEDVELPLPLFTLSFRTRPGYLSTDLHLTTSTCGECIPDAGDATIQVIGAGPTFTPTSTPSTTGTPTPLPTPTFGPSPTWSGPFAPPDGLLPTATIPVAAVPATSAAGLLFFGVALAAIGFVTLLHKRW